MNLTNSYTHSWLSSRVAWWFYWLHPTTKWFPLHRGRPFPYRAMFLKFWRQQSLTHYRFICFQVWWPKLTMLLSPVVPHQSWPPTLESPAVLAIMATTPESPAIMASMESSVTTTAVFILIHIIVFIIHIVFCWQCTLHTPSCTCIKKEKLK